MKGVFNLLEDETFHCKWYFTCNEPQFPPHPPLKTAQNPVSTVEFLFHKDTQIYRKAILDKPIINVHILTTGTTLMLGSVISS